VADVSHARVAERRDHRRSVVARCFVHDDDLEVEVLLV
jgi:hypothetical protein